jgi:hypothetical protein
MARMCCSETQSGNAQEVLADCMVYCVYTETLFSLYVLNPLT